MVSTMRLASLYIPQRTSVLTSAVCVAYLRLLSKTIKEEFSDEEGTKEIAESVTDTGYYGDTVKTKAIDVYGYTLVTSPDTTTETFAKNDKTVIYEYSKNPGEVTEEEITKEGSDTPVGKDELFTYDISYNATIDDFAGTVTTTITDTLPYAIDASASDLQGGTYNSSNNTITWTFDTEINEDNQDIAYVHDCRPCDQLRPLPEI